MYRKALKRDVEWLLNTRQPSISEMDSYPETAASVLNFGLPDIQSFNGSYGRENKNLLAAIEKCIRVFEPRILHPRVFLERADSLSRSLKFRIEGRLQYEDMDEEVKFDTVLELISGEYEVK
jgi:type VI secretion system protein ImpF